MSKREGRNKTAHIPEWISFKTSLNTSILLLLSQLWFMVPCRQEDPYLCLHVIPTPITSSRLSSHRSASSTPTPNTRHPLSEDNQTPVLVPCCAKSHGTSKIKASETETTTPPPQQRCRERRRRTNSRGYPAGPPDQDHGSVSRPATPHSRGLSVF
jgi:hypothetical protein